MARKRRLTGEAALNAAYTKTDHAPLLAAWGVELPDELLRLALTHRSFANENDNLPDNERLEFLGDAVLGLSVAERLYKDFPGRSESDISKMRAAIVNSHALASVGRELDLGRYILLGRGEMRTDGANRTSILEDTVEAIIGAVYLHHGFEVARATVMRILGSRIENLQVTGFTMDWKTALIEAVTEQSLAAPSYETTSTGPAHEQEFHCELTIADRLTTQGTGLTKKEAEHNAARAAVKKLRDRA